MSHNVARSKADELWLNAASGNFSNDGPGDGVKKPPKVSAVSFRRTSQRSDGRLELEAGEALLDVVNKLGKVLLPGASREGGTAAGAAGGPGGPGIFQAKELLSTGPGKGAGVGGQEIAFVGVNKAVENRATINLMLMRWEDAPRTVLVVEKSDKMSREGGVDGARMSNRAVMALEGLCRHCYEALHLIVIVEARLRRELPHLAFLRSCDEDSEEEEEEHPRKAQSAEDRARKARLDMQRRLSGVDFCIALGHDGACVAAAALFDGAVPPILPLTIDAEGILSRISFTEAKPTLAKVVEGGFHLGMRARLCCKLFSAKTGRTHIIYALNDVVLDRGPSPFLTSVECFCNDRLVTLVQGDGLILATPTGSTAYSQAAGGSMVHPSVPCILFTPLNPHSLSFRPIVLPVSVRVKLQLTKGARSPAWVSFDGRQRQPLDQGDTLTVNISQWPVPVISLVGATDDWLEGCNAFLSRMVTEYVTRLRLRPAL